MILWSRNTYDKDLHSIRFNTNKEKERDIMALKWHTTLIVMYLVNLFSGLVFADLIPVVYLYDGNTPLELLDPNVPCVYTDIMVGSRLVIEIGSDTPGRVDSPVNIYTFEPYLDMCTLSPRDFNETILNWEGSILPAAGRGAHVLLSPDTNVYDDGRLYNDISCWVSWDAIPGPWFVFDYIAQQEGTCVLDIYTTKGMSEIYIQSLIFEHVPSRDFNDDGKVDFIDFSYIAGHWPGSSVPDPNTSDPNNIEPDDLDKNGVIDIYDLQLFLDYWLEVTHLS